MTDDYSNLGIGIDVSIDESSDDELRKKGFHQINQEEFTQYNHILNTVFDEMNKSYRKSQYESYMDGAYRVIIKPGTRLTNSRTTDNLSAMTQDANHKASGAAELKPLSCDSIQIKDLAATSIFKILSQITGQYYLAKINDRFSGVEQMLNSILEYIDENAAADLQTNLARLKRICSHIEYIEPNTSRATNAANAIDAINMFAEKRMNIIKKYVGRCLNEFDNSDSPEEFMGKIAKLQKLTLSYKQTVQLFFETTVLLILIYNIQDPVDLSKYTDELINLKKEYVGFLKEASEAINEYIKTSDKLNKTPVGRKVLAISKDIGEVVGSIAFSYYSRSCLSTRVIDYAVDNVINRHQKLDSDLKQQKIKAIMKKNKFIAECTDTKPLDDSISSLEDLITRIELSKLYQVVVHNRVIYTDSPFTLSSKDEIAGNKTQTA